MVKLNVKIVSMQDADKFNKICSKFDCDMDLQSGKYYVDAKSIMGIFSLDLSKPIDLAIGNHSGAFAALRKECRLNFVLLCLYGLTFFTECAQ